MYYNGNQNGSFVVTAQVTNTGGGLQYLRFPDTTSSGVLSNVTANGVYSWGYAFSPTATFSGTAIVTAANSVNNYQAAQFSVIRDVLAPDVQVSAPTKIVSGVIAVSWSATGESGSGWNGLSTVSVMTDTGPLQAWLSNTPATSATFRVSLFQSASGSSSPYPYPRLATRHPQERALDARRQPEPAGRNPLRLTCATACLSVVELQPNVGDQQDVRAWISRCDSRPGGPRIG